MSSILVVDDQKEVADSIASILEKNGFAVDIAYSGSQCLEKDRQEPITVVFLDIMMPEIDGYKVAEELKKRHGGNIKIVFVSIKPKAEVTLQHVDGYIQKPFDLHEIIVTAKQMTS